MSDYSFKNAEEQEAHFTLTADTQLRKNMFDITAEKFNEKADKYTNRNCYK